MAPSRQRTRSPQPTRSSTFNGVSVLGNDVFKTDALVKQDTGFGSSTKKEKVRDRGDLVIESHDNAFSVKKWEMLFGYQSFATKDPKIFENAKMYVADRFVGEGEKLLKYVLWSNGPEIENPSLGNKQCARKDFVVLFSRLLVVELFLRYDSFEVEVGTSPLGASVNITSLKKASS
ncbi:allene oxide synthase 1, chloroplastic-like [Vigna radiata var. radiata]|uniref:Allene oxide synthase 1, chloroplastic-like n=1 Tax=Vigna radiata var. radiata TaxID=3916 RepID=A0A1S3VN07_VIGRR|nr:allene oxide synthase 1, chloroplastic-like [Vigna radiata var. radiata]